MSDNFNNEFKFVVTDNQEVTALKAVVLPTVYPAERAGLEFENLNQRDTINVLLFAKSGSIPAGVEIVVKYYSIMRDFSGGANTHLLLKTETITTDDAINEDGHLLVEAECVDYADYFTLDISFVEASDSAYEVASEVIVKKKIDSDAGGGSVDPSDVESIIDQYVLDKNIPDATRVERIINNNLTALNLKNVVIYIPCSDMKGGTAKSYEVYNVDGYPYIIKNMGLGDTTMFDMNLIGVDITKEVEYAVRFMLISDEDPDSTSSAFFDVNNMTIHYDFNNEEKNDIIVTQFIMDNSYIDDGRGSITYSHQALGNNYEQNIGVLGVYVRYTRV